MRSGVAASGNTMLGLFPPNSRETCANRAPATSPTCLPTSVEPVNDTLSTPGCRSSASPTTLPLPVTTFRTPGGRKGAAISAISRMVSGASSAGLSTTVLPAASAAGTFIAAIISGEFHGRIAATTPSGSRRVYCSWSSPAGNTVPLNSPAIPPK